MDNCYFKRSNYITRRMSTFTCTYYGGGRLIKKVLMGFSIVKLGIPNSMSKQIRGIEIGVKLAARNATYELKSNRCPTSQPRP